MKPKNNEYIFFKKYLLKSIGYICRCVRLRHNMTQIEMASRCGIATEQISKFENGLYNSIPIYYQYYKLMNDDERNQVYEIS